MGSLVAFSKDTHSISTSSLVVCIFPVRCLASAIKNLAWKRIGLKVGVIARPK